MFFIQQMMPYSPHTRRTYLSSTALPGTHESVSQGATINEIHKSLGGQLIGNLRNACEQRRIIICTETKGLWSLTTVICFIDGPEVLVQENRDQLR